MSKLSIFYSWFITAVLTGFMALQIGKSLIYFEITDVFYFGVAGFCIWYIDTIKKMIKDT
jgi:hypothetical protein